MEKKGLSDVVATVLITMITIAAVGIISVFVFNFMNSKTISLSSLDLSLKNIEAYWNNQPVPPFDITPIDSKETVYVSVERSSDKTNLTGLEFVFSVDGNSYSCTRRVVPRVLETSVYAFKASIFNKKPDKVTVIPIVSVGESEKIVSSGFEARLFETVKEFKEKIDECGGFCCGANGDLPESVSNLPR